MEMALILFGAVGARVGRRIDRTVWSALMLWAVCCSVLLFPISTVLWKILPKLQFMQFPWRWLLCLSVIFTIFVAIGLRQSWMRSLVFTLSILVIAVAWHRMQAPWWDNAAGERIYDNRFVIWAHLKWGRLKAYEVYEDTEKAAALDQYLEAHEPALAGA